MDLKQFLFVRVQETKERYTQDQSFSVWLKKWLLSPLLFWQMLWRIWRVVLLEAYGRGMKDMLVGIVMALFFTFMGYYIVALVFVLLFTSYDVMQYGHILGTFHTRDPVWYQLQQTVLNHPLIGVAGTSGLLLNGVLYFCLTIWLIVLGYSVASWLRGPGKIVTKYADSDFAFTDDEYVQAAKLLEEWSPRTYESATSKASERTVDILCLAEALYKNKQGKLCRGVAINAIKEDREARADED